MRGFFVKSGRITNFELQTLSSDDMTDIFQLYSQVWMTYLMYGINLLLTIVTFVCLWYILEKMKQPGWKGIIPWYNIWALVKYMKKPLWWFWAQVAGMAVFLLLSYFIAGRLAAAMYLGVPFSETLFIVYGAGMIMFLIAMLVLQVFISHALSKSFSRGGWFTAGLLFLPFVFFPILAFGDDEFIEPQKTKTSLPLVF